jgi:DNA repair protein RadA
MSKSNNSTKKTTRKSSKKTSKRTSKKVSTKIDKIETPDVDNSESNEIPIDDDLVMISAEESGDEEEEEDDSWIADVKSRLEELNAVGPAIAEKLVLAGYYNYNRIAVTSAKKLSTDSDISETTCKKIIRSARTKLNIQFKSATQVMAERQNVERFTTGSENLDVLVSTEDPEPKLGIETKSMYEWFGEFRTGKTQICHQACVTVQLPIEHGGLDAEALFIDAEGTFRPERILQIARKYKDKLDITKVTDRIHYCRVFSADHQMATIQEIPELIRKNKIKLVIIDSIIGHLRAEYTGRGTLSERQQNLNKQLHELINLAEAYKLTIFVTNQVSAKPGSLFATSGPVGGHIMAHASTYRIQLKKGKKTTRIAKLIDSPSLPEREAVFIIADSGIEDTKK